MRKITCLDAGHGGKDPGAVDGKSTGDALYTEEEDIALAVVLKVGPILHKRGVAVVYTRKGDTYPSLENRCRTSNAAGAHLFCSVHFNAGPAAAQGIETLYVSPTGKKAAAAVQKRLEKVSPWDDRGVKLRTDLHVLNGTNAPAILVEGGFVTNTEEEKQLHLEAYQNKLAHAIANGICDFLGIKYDPVRPPATKQKRIVTIGPCSPEEATAVVKKLQGLRLKTEVKNA